MEIERKYRLQGVPSVLAVATSSAIAQGYLFTTDGEARVRRRDDEYWLTVKGDGALAREEWEVPIPAWVFTILWAHAPARVAKTRYTLRDGPHIHEIDVFHDALEGLVVLEVEFASIDDAQAFALPAWAQDAIDVTSDARYKNKHLATHQSLPT